MEMEASTSDAVYLYRMKQLNKYYVYYLIDPVTNLPFYVGKGFGNRMYNHEKSVLSGRIPNNNGYLFNKINKILKECGYIKYHKIIDDIDENSALLKEIEEIKKIGRSDLKLGSLCNLTDGGEGVSGLKFSEKTKEKMSLKRNNWIEIHGHSFLGKHHSESSKKKISEKNILRFKDPKNRELVSKNTKIGMAKSDYVSRVSKTITLKNFNGNIITVKNISKFCRDNYLTNANIYKLLKGEIYQHKGWRLP